MSRKLTIVEMQSIAESRRGVCLSSLYVNNQTKLKWRCKLGHIWSAVPNSVKLGTWCPTCARISLANNRRLNIDEMKELARSRKGECLSESYKDSRTKLKWKCENGHIWEAAPAPVKSGGWCPECWLGVGERICRKIFERLFSKEFPKVRPPWLKAPTGKSLELDGYNEELKLAFEYQGHQHYLDEHWFHTKTKGGIKKRQSYDNLKKSICHKKGITLIEIPYNIPYEELADYIINKCKKSKIKVPDTESINYKILDVYSPEALKEMKLVAKNKGGKCLSKQYINNKTKLKWQCKEGHKWEAIPDSVRRGTWCRECAGLLKDTIEEMRTLAEKNGGKCLSKEYMSNHKPLEWECRKGHTWKNTPAHVKAGQWCRICAGYAFLTIDNMADEAKKKEGKCLSKEYQGPHTKILWECKKGHQFLNTPAHVKSGRWCAKCAGKKKYTIEEINELAKIKGGKCISDKYINVFTKLKLKCSRNHVWSVIPRTIIRGSWCPICARLKK